MSRRHAITLASCAVACCATSSLRPVGSAARATELASPRWSVIKARLRVLDLLMLTPLWTMAAQPGTVKLLIVDPAMSDINARAGVQERQTLACPSTPGRLEAC